MSPKSFFFCFNRQESVIPWFWSSGLIIKQSRETLRRPSADPPQTFRRPFADLSQILRRHFADTSQTLRKTLRSTQNDGNGAASRLSVATWSARNWATKLANEIAKRNQIKFSGVLWGSKSLIRNGILWRDAATVYTPSPRLYTGDSSLWRLCWNRSNEAKIQLSRNSEIYTPDHCLPLKVRLCKVSELILQPTIPNLELRQRSLTLEVSLLNSLLPCKSLSRFFCLQVSLVFCLSSILRLVASRFSSFFA